MGMFLVANACVIINDNMILILYTDPKYVIAPVLRNQNSLRELKKSFAGNFVLLKIELQTDCWSCESY